MTNNQQPTTSDAELPTSINYPVTVWEGIGLAVGAVLLVAIGLAGLVYKFFINAANPQRATSIAQSLMDYKIPMNAQGVFGANLGGAKVAIVSSPSFPKDASTLPAANLADIQAVELFIARVPLDIETTENAPPKVGGSETSEPYDIFSSPDFSFSYRSGEEFQVASEQIEKMLFCGQVVPVRIQEGKLALINQAPPVSAVKYDAIAVYDNSKRQITLTAIGPNAKRQTATVFNSLRCK